MSYKDELSNYAYTLVSALWQAGVKDVVISPGSRSTPLAYAFASLQEFEVYRQVDERSAAFLALGIAKAKNAPVILLCTSGSAAANYFPAIVEARYARVPLIVITADRPHELREVGAPQTINQIQLFGEQVKWSVDYPIPDDAPQTLPFIERHTQRAVSIAKTAPFGPVHLNVPFREPLLIEFKEKPVAPSFSRSFQADSAPSIDAISFLKETIEATEKGIIVMGELANKVSHSVLWSFIREMKWPVLVDSLSNLRANVPTDCELYVIDQYDAILKSESFRTVVAPETVIRFGAQPVSKPLAQFITQVQPSTYIVMDESPLFRDSLQVSTHHIQASVGQWLQELVVDGVNEMTPYTKTWTEANAIASKQVSAYKMTMLDEGALAATLFEHLPDGSDLISGSSMPIRDVDTFFQKTTKDIQIFANRGTNGIDGVVSTALGIQLANKRPAYLLIGDLSMLHDTNGLLATRYQACDLTIIVMNNDGGGIFSYLPQSSERTYYEQLFGTPTGLTFGSLAKMYDAEYKSVTTKEELQLTLQTPKEKPIRLIEVFTNREHNINSHRKLWKDIVEELDERWKV